MNKLPINKVPLPITSAPSLASLTRKLISNIRKSGSNIAPVTISHIPLLLFGLLLSLFLAKIMPNTNKRSAVRVTVSIIKLKNINPILINSYRETYPVSLIIS